MYYGNVRYCHWGKPMKGTWELPLPFLQLLIDLKLYQSIRRFLRPSFLVINACSQYGKKSNQSSLEKSFSTFLKNGFAWEYGAKVLH